MFETSETAASGLKLPCPKCGGDTNLKPMCRACNGTGLAVDKKRTTPDVGSNPHKGCGTGA